MKTEQLNFCHFVHLTADSKSRWPHGRKAYFRVGRLHMRSLIRCLVRFRVQNVPYPTLHECCFCEASRGLERKLSPIISRHPSFQFLLTWRYFVAELRDYKPVWGRLWQVLYAKSDQNRIEIAWKIACVNGPLNSTVEQGDLIFCFLFFIFICTGCRILHFDQDFLGWFIESLWPSHAHHSSDQCVDTHDSVWQQWVDTGLVKNKRGLFKNSYPCRTIAHFTVMCFVAEPLWRGEAWVDFTLLENFFVCFHI